MKLFEKCLIACDIDGTLMVNGLIPEINKEKIRFFIENGGEFAISTGRSACAVKDVFDQLDCLSIGTYANGTVIYDRKSEKILFDKTLDKSEYEIMFKVNEQFPEIGIEIHFQDRMGVYNATEETEHHIRYESMDDIPLNKKDLESIKANKILYLASSFEEMKRIKSFVGQFDSESDFVETTVSYYGRQRFFIEQIYQGMSKAVGVAKLADILGTEKGCIYAIGDYYNDIEMLAAADISAVPVDSPEEVKANAAYITRSAENGAVADFIDHLTEIRSR